MTWADFFAAFPDPFSFYQLMGWIAVGFYVASFQCLNPRRTILMCIPGNVAMSVHYIGMNSFTACALALGAIVRDSVGAFGSKRYLHMTIALYVVFIWLCCTFLATHLHDYLLTVGTTFTCMAALSRDNFWRYRFFSAVQQVFLFSGFLLMGSYPGMTMILLVMGSNITGIIRKVRQDARLQVT